MKWGLDRAAGRRCRELSSKGPGLDRVPCLDPLLKRHYYILHTVSSGITVHVPAPCMCRHSSKGNEHHHTYTPICDKTTNNVLKHCLLVCSRGSFEENLTGAGSHLQNRGHQVRPRRTCAMRP